MTVKKKRISLLIFAASSAQAIHSHASSPAANAIVLITDAQLSHADTVRDMLRRHLTNARVFVLGCGSRVRCGFPLRFVLPHSLVTSLFSPCLQQTHCSVDCANEWRCCRIHHSNNEDAVGGPRGASAAASPSTRCVRIDAAVLPSSTIMSLCYLPSFHRL